MKLHTLILLLGIFCIVGCGSDRETALESPEGKVTAEVFLDEAKALYYKVDFKGVTVVEPSRLGITIEGVDLGAGVVLGTPTLSEFDETYATRGVKNMARNHYRLWGFPVTHSISGREYQLQVRVYDDGAAYRYIVPGEGVQHVDGESSSWTIVDGTKVWYFERTQGDWKLKSYAGWWLSSDINTLESATPEKFGTVQGVPLVLDLPNDLGYAALTKAACYNYSGMRLDAVGNRTVVANFTEGEKGFDVEGTITTPWRATLLADDLNQLVNSDFIKNLNPAPDPELFADTSYIKPGRSVWRYEPFDTGSPAEERAFVDYAAELGYEYSMVDSGWNEAGHPFRTIGKKGFDSVAEWEPPWQRMKELCDYAAERNVGIWAWCHSQFLMDPTNNYAYMGRYFGQLREAGVVGVKIDFMNGESKEIIDFEEAVLRLAAERQLLVNFHGCHASTGEERTYPNELTREGIRGMEVNKHTGSTIPASHNAALPFTRFLVGHGDYTPLDYTKPGETTWAHQLATLVNFISPLQVIANDPGFMINHPIAKQALNVTRAIPATWDETVVLPGSDIAKLAAIARRSGDQWFVGILNGDLETKQYELDLSFLPEGDFTAELVSDDLQTERIDVTGINPRSGKDSVGLVVPFKVEAARVSHAVKLTVELAAGGGFVAVFTKR